MNNRKTFAIFAVVVSLIAFRHVACADDEGPGGAPYPNDAGPAEVDVSKYPADIQADYKVFARRCSQCHSLARPINSENLQLTPEEQAAAKKSDPKIFTDPKIWRISDKVWTDYVNKMKEKPGAIMRESEIPKIVAFLVYDSKERKMGANAASWQAQRQKLLDDFKTSNPKRYSEIFGK